MNRPFEDLTLAQRLTLQELARTRFHSEKDQTYLVTIRCDGCGSTFEELYKTAYEDVIMTIKPVCIRCDPVAEEKPPGGGLSAIVGWLVNL